MSLLFNKEHTRTDQFRYLVNASCAEDQGKVEITFVDKQFARANVPFCGVWSRFAWKVLVGIEEEITKLEQEFVNEK